MAEHPDITDEILVDVEMGEVAEMPGIVSAWEAEEQAPSDNWDIMPKKGCALFSFVWKLQEDTKRKRLFKHE